MSVRSAGLVKQLCRTIAAVEQGSEGTVQMGLLHHANIAELYSLYHYFTLTENLNKKGRGKIYRVPGCAHTVVFDFVLLFEVLRRTYVCSIVRIN